MKRPGGRCSAERRARVARAKRCALCLFALAAAFTGAARLEGREIFFFESLFVPQSVTVERGATVTFVWRQGVHTVTSGLPDGLPGTPDEPGARFDVVLDEENPTFALTIGLEETAGVPFFDRENPGQIGFIDVESGEVTVRVGVVDNAFLPETVYLFAGDSVRWEHEPNEAFHTVTSGRSSRPEDNPGALFDEESSDLKPIFVYRFVEPGGYPYFCRPHESMQMKGVVHVQRLFLRGDATGDGRVDTADAIAILMLLFAGDQEPSCLDALDVNDDGRIDVSDSVFGLLFLFSGGVPVPAPYPVEGPDRTEDGLYCWP